MKLSDYFISDKPSKLMLLDQDGNEQGDYLEVIGADSPTVSRKKAAWQTASIKLQRELKAIEERAGDDKTIDEDIQRKSEIINYEMIELDAGFAESLVTGWSFDEELDRKSLEVFLQQGNLANAVIAMAFDSERLKKN